MTLRPRSLTSGLALDPRTLDDAHGPTLVVADTNNHVVRAVNATTGEARTLAGRGHAGFKDGKARKAEFAGPSDVAVAPCGTVFVADMFNHRVRVISPDGASVRTLAGAAEAGAADGAADGAARLDHPNCLVLDVARGMLYLTEMKGQAVRAIDVSSVLNPAA